MTAISGGDLTLLRNRRHKATTHVSFLKPATLWSARVNDGSIAREETSIAFDGGSGSSFSSIIVDQEVWVGTAAGQDDVGRARVRSISSGDSGVTGTLTVARNPIIWTDDLYLTFKHDYPLKPKYSLLGSGGEFYKDGDITYTDENEEPPPVVVAGGHRAGFIDPTAGYLEINVDLTGSYVMASGASISSYGMSVVPSGGYTTNFNTSTGQGYLRFSTSGYRWVTFSVTDDNGKTETSHRCYIAHPTDKTDSDYPKNDYQLANISWDWGRGGWQTSITLRDDATLTDIPDKTLCIVWQQATYGSTSKNITLLDDESSTLFCGYVRNDTTSQNISDGSGQTAISLTTIEDLLKQHYHFSIHLQAAQSPSDWWQYSSWLTTGRTIHHFWRWHSTLLQVCDVVGLNDDSLGRAAAISPDGNLYSVADTIAQNIRAHIVCDKGGRVHLANDMQLLNDTERAALDTLITIDSTPKTGDLSQEFSFLRQPDNRAALVSVSGFAYSGTFDADGVPNPTPYCALAPGSVPDYDGPVVPNYDQQVFSDQTHAQQMSGRYYARDNNEYKEWRIQMAGNYLGIFDLPEQSWVTRSMLSTQNVREIVWTTKKFIPRSGTASFTQDGGSISISVNLEPEMDGNDGVATDCTFNVIPTPSGLDFEIPDIPLGQGSLLTSGSIYFKGGSGVSWEERNTDEVFHMGLDPFSVLKADSIYADDAIVWFCEDGSIWRSDDACQTATDMTPGTDPPNSWGDTPAPTAEDLTYIQYEGDPFVQDRHFFLATWQNGSSEWRSWILSTDDDGTSWEWVNLGTSKTETTFGVSYFVPRITGNAKAHSMFWLTSTTIAIVTGISNDAIVYIYDTDTDTITGSAISQAGGEIVAGARLSDTAIGTIYNDTDVSGLYTAIVDDSATKLDDATIISGSHSVTAVAVERISDTKFVIFYNHDGSSALGKAVVAEYSGGTLSLGSVFEFHGSAVSHVACIPTDTAGQVVLFFTDDTAGLLKGLRCTISGTSISFGNPQTIYTGAVDSLSAAHLTGNQALVSFATSTDSGRVIACTVIDDGVTLGSSVEFDSDTQETYTAAQSGTLGYVAYRSGTNDLFYRTCSISGHTISLGSETDYSSTGEYPLIIHGGVGLVLGFSDDSNSDFFTLSYTSVSSDCRAVGAAVSETSGSYLYITSLNTTTEELEISTYITTGVIFLYRTSLGGCTNTELEDRDWWAHPFSPSTDSDGVVFVFGRMDAPGALSGTHHIIKSISAGVTFSSVESGWGSDWCSALIAGSDYQMFAFRSNFTRTKVYEGNFDTTIGLSVLSTLPFAADLLPFAVAYDWFDGTIYACPNDDVDEVVVASVYPYVFWVDITYDHGGAPVTAIIVL